MKNVEKKFGGSPLKKTKLEKSELSEMARTLIKKLIFEFFLKIGKGLEIETDMTSHTNI
jgi:hypothetical protein